MVYKHATQLGFHQVLSVPLKSSIERSWHLSNIIVSYEYFTMHVSHACFNYFHVSLVQISATKWTKVKASRPMTSRFPMSYILSPPQHLAENIYNSSAKKKKIYKLVDKYTWSLKWTYSNPTPPAPAACYSTSTYRCMVYLVLSSYRERSHCHCLSCFVQCLLCLLSIVSYPSVMRFTLLHIPEKVYRCM